MRIAGAYHQYMAMGVGPARVALIGLLLFALVGCRAAAQPTTSSLPSSVPSAAATTSGSSAPSETPLASIATGAGLQWTEVGSFGEAGTAEYATGVTRGAGGFVAVGNHYDDPPIDGFGPIGPHEGRIWVSPDGRSWADVTPPDTFADAVLEHILTLSDDSLVAIGRVTVPVGNDPPDGDLEPLAAWESADGLIWRRVDSGLPPASAAQDVEQGRKGSLAALRAADGSVSQLWLSTDGRHWEQVYATVAGEVLTDIGAGLEGFIAAGYSGQGDTAESFVIASSDGRDWIRSHSPPVDALRVAPLGADWIAISPGSLSDAMSPVWFSTNGLEWSKVGTLALETIRGDITCLEYPARLDSAAGWLVVSMVLSGCGEAAFVNYGRALISLDGVSWDVLPYSEGSTSHQDPRLRPDLVASDSALILVGQSNGRASFWLGELP
jgi:hypothetical protein